MKEGRKSEYPEKTADDEPQKMPPTKAGKFKPNRDSNPLSSIAGSQGSTRTKYCTTRRPNTRQELSVGCLTSQQFESVSQGRVCEDKFTCCLTEIEVTDQTFHLTQSQYTDTGPTSPSTDPITPGAWQGNHWCANF